MRKLIMCVLPLCLVITAVSAQRGTVRGGSQWGHAVLEALVKARGDQSIPPAQMNVDRWDNVRNIERFCAGDCQILFHRAALSSDESAQLNKQWPEGGIQPSVRAWAIS